MKKLKNKKNEEVDSYYINILEELAEFENWCISDDIAWGIPIPFFKFKNNGKILMDCEIIEHFAKLVSEYGTSDIWFVFDI